jgi:hypothetical protein
MTWRLARSLEVLRDQINTAAPSRSKKSDGTIGDVAHASRSSDHNPHVRDGAVGVVTAIDITHDPANGVDCHAIAETLRAAGDVRLEIIIWDRRIWNPQISPKWRPYSGSNPHTKHIHISVRETKNLYDDARPWQWRLVPPASVDVAKLGSHGPLIEAYQARLRDLGYAVGTVNGDYGSFTRAAVLAFQAENGLPTTGEIDPATRVALNSGQARRMPIGARVMATETDLAKAGSGTINDARAVEAVVKVTGGGQVTAAAESSLGLIDTAKQYTSMFGDLQGVADSLLEIIRFMLRNWWLVVLLATVFVLWKTDAIKRARVLAHRLGQHLGR